MCRINHHDAIHCDRCDKILTYRDFKRVPCQDARQTGKECRLENCKHYRMKSQNTKFIQSWQNCEDCTKPESFMKNLSLKSVATYAKDEIRLKKIGKDDPFAKNPRTRDMSPFHAQYEQGSYSVKSQTLEEALEELKLENAVKHMRVDDENCDTNMTM